MKFNGKIVKRLREKKGLSLRRFLKLINKENFDISYQTLANYETNSIKKVDTYLLMRIADVLGVQFLVFFEQEKEK